MSENKRASVEEPSRSIRARPAHSKGQAEPWPSPSLAGRATAVLYLACGLMSLVCLLPPGAPGVDKRGVLLVGLGAALLAPVSWFLPWQRWPRWVGLSRVLVGLALLALINTFEGDDPYIYAVFFLTVFVWIGVVHPPFTALKLMPLYAAAYMLPLLFRSGPVALAAQAGLWVGILCLMVAEVPAWLVSRWRRSQRALQEAHEAVEDIATQLAAAGQDPATLWQASAARLCALVDVPDCDIYRVNDEQGLVCIGSMLDSAPYPEYLGKRGELSLWAVDREALQTRSPVLVCSPDDPRLSDEERAEMLAWHEHAMLIVPLVVGEQAIGVVEIGENRAGRTITSEQAATAASVCRLIALSVHDAEANENLSERTRSLSALLQATQAVSASVVLEEVLEQVARSAAGMIGSPECAIWEYDPAAEALIERAAYSQDPQYLPSDVVLLSDEPAEAAVLFGGQPLVEHISDPGLHPTSRASMENYGEKTCLTVALRFGDEAVGLIVACETATERQFSPAEVQALEVLGGQAAVAIHNAQLYRRQEKHAHRLASLLESSRAIASAGSMEEALAVVTRSAVELFGVTSGIAYEYDPELDAIVARAVCERAPNDWNKLGEPLPLAESPVERDVLTSGRALLECISDPQLDPVSRLTMERWGDRSCLTVPMQSVDGAMGLLTLWDSERERRYSEDELALATSLAELAGEAVRSTKLMRRLRSLSETDSLTGLANHRKVHAFLALEQARAERYGSHFSLAMLDIDDFKLLNDTYGHPAGDVVLRQVAGLLKEQTRASDVVGRYGGDEFLLILPETASAEAGALAEKLRAALAEQPYVTASGEQIPLRASIGIAGYPHDGRDANELVAAADANLYASKRRGGDAVTGSEQAPPSENDEGGAFGLFESLVIAVDNKDSYTRRHSEEVTEHALALAGALGLSETSQRVLRVAGLLHDVGKIGIPDRILRKPGRLTEAEFEIVKGHPVMGETIIAAIPDVEEIRAAVISHHERYDGTGYPHGLAKNRIPLLGRIMAVADAYSAMTTDRPYRKALSPEEALAELRACSGSQFDPKIVAAFVRCIGGYGARPSPPVSRRVITRA